MRWFSLAPPISDLSLLVWIWCNTDKLIHISINPPFCMKWSLILLMWHQWFVCCFHLLTWCVFKAAAVACIWYPLSDLIRFQIPHVIEAAHVHRASYTYSTISILYCTVGTGFYAKSTAHYSQFTALMFAQDLQYVQPAGKCFKTIHAKNKNKKTFKVYRHFHNCSAMKCRPTTSFSSSFNPFSL